MGTNLTEINKTLKRIIQAIQSDSDLSKIVGGIKLGGSLQGLNLQPLLDLLAIEESGNLENIKEKFDLGGQMGVEIVNAAGRLIFGGTSAAEYLSDMFTEIDKLPTKLDTVTANQEQGLWDSLFEYHTLYEVTSIVGGTTVDISVSLTTAVWAEVDTIGIIVTGPRSFQSYAYYDSGKAFERHRFGNTAPKWVATNPIRITNQGHLQWKVSGVTTATEIYVIVQLRCKNTTPMLIAQNYNGSATTAVLADYAGPVGTFTTP